MIFQLQRPSAHSYIILASHASFIFCIREAIRRRLFVESMSLLLSATISMFYHLCDENFHCAFGIDIYGWHAADVWSTFFLICFVLGVMVLNINNKLWRTILRMAYLTAITVFVWTDPGNMVLLGSLLVVVATTVTLKFSLFPDKCNLSSSRRQERNQFLAVGLGTFALALGCFVVANTPIVGPITYSADIHGPRKPMDVPDTAVYWVFHSIWHFLSAVSGYFIIRYLVFR